MAELVPNMHHFVVPLCDGFLYLWLNSINSLVACLWLNKALRDKM